MPNYEIDKTLLYTKNPLRPKPKPISRRELLKRLKHEGGVGIKPILFLCVYILCIAAFFALALLVNSFEIKLLLFVAMLVVAFLLWFVFTKKILSDTYMTPCFFFSRSSENYAISTIIADNNSPVKVIGYDKLVIATFTINTLEHSGSVLKTFFFELLSLFNNRNFAFVAMKFGSERGIYTFSIALYTSLTDTEKINSLLKSRHADNITFTLRDDPDWKDFDTFRPEVEDVDRIFVEQTLRFLKYLSFDTNRKISFTCVFAFSDSLTAATFSEDGIKNGFSQVQSIEKTPNGFNVTAIYNVTPNRKELLEMLSLLRALASKYNGSLLDSFFHPLP